MERIFERQGYQATGKSPAAIAATVGVYILIGAAVVLMPKEQFKRHVDIITLADPIPMPKDPPPEPQPPVEHERTVQKPLESHVDSFPPVKPLPNDGGMFVKPGPSGDTLTFDPGPKIIPEPPAPPAPFIDARPDPRFAANFQPAYPPGKLRLQEEGSVTVRVTIGVDGRVTAVELVSASDPAFWEAAQRQALRKWRFTPATRGGVPVESSRTMTVRFKLAE